MVDQARQEIEPRPIEAMRNAMIAKRPDAGIKQNFRAGAGRRIAAFYRIQIGNEIAQHERAPA